MNYFIFQLYDRISSKVVSPMRSPASDAVERCRDAIFYLREFEHSTIDPDIDYADIDDLREILLKPHFRVSDILNSNLFESPRKRCTVTVVLTLNFADFYLQR